LISDFRDQYPSSLEFQTFDYETPCLSRSFSHLISEKDRKKKSKKQTLAKIYSEKKGRTKGDGRWKGKGARIKGRERRNEMEWQR